MANDFSGDSDVIALYNFENGVLTSDSKNSNTLTNNNTVTADLVNFKEGSASGLFAKASDKFMDIADSAMQSDFPLKSGTSNNVFSILGWFRFTVDTGDRQGIVSKYETDSRRSFSLQVRDRDMNILMGYNSGGSSEGLYTGSTDPIIQDIWHHYNMTFNNGSWTLRVYSANTDSIVVDVSGTAANAISILSVPWTIGSYRPDVGGNAFDGNIDETVFFKRIVSDADQDSIIAGTYTSGSPTIPLSGSTNSTTLLSGSITLTKSLAGSTDSISLLSGNLSLKKSLSGSSNSISLLSGDLSITGSVELSGSTNSITALSGDLSVKKSLSGSSASVTLLSGDLTIKGNLELSGSTNSISSLTGNINLKKDLAGSTNSITLLTGNLTIPGSQIGPISISIELSKSNISIGLQKPEISIGLSRKNISMELKT